MPQLLTQESHKWYALLFVHKAMEEDKNQNTLNKSKKILFHHRWNANTVCTCQIKKAM